MPRRRRRVMRRFRINEISGVDKPAQEGARITILKRAEADDMDEKVKKQLEDQQKTIDDLTKLTKGLQTIVTLGASEREHYDSLPGNREKAEFLSKSADEQKVIVTEAAAEKARKAEGDPVVYTTMDGDEILKSHGDVILRLAKSHDKERKKTAKLQADREQADLEKRAETELKYLPGDLKVRASMLKAVEAIEDEDTRKSALETLKAQNKQMKTAFDTAGVKDSPAPGSDEDKIQKLADARFEEQAGKETREQSYAKVMETPEAQALVSEPARA